METVLGVDAGGTVSRAVLTGRDGTVLGTGRAGPGNPSRCGAAAVTAIGRAVRGALTGHDPGSVGAAVVGVAGLSGVAAVAGAFEREWKSIGLTCEVPVVGDAVTAFAAGSAESAGAVLIAGTGAVAAVVDGMAVVRVADGLGWLLGDEGSGTWIGLQAVRAAVRRDSPLAAAIMRYAGVTSSDALVNWAGRQPPTVFAGLCPLVCATADPVAGRILDDAVARLLATLAELGGTGPVVLAGALLTGDTPVRRGVVAALGDRATVAGDPALGAARLALRRS
ncbi:MAG TPA: BadF/BadG/BcrA/BcrD ATPase family protein [Actinoplanes sp.]|nr:BadF/BadG/BcrA/BcrD ATPase family protein [Actinoplanes sp.]